MMQAVENKEPYLIICSGILPEPLSVVIQNFARKTIDVVVATVASDEFSIHTLVDLGAVCLTDPVSALKGDTISQATTRGLKKIDSVDLSRETLNIQNSKSRNATSNLLADVIQRSNSNQDIAHLFQKRLKCLSSSKINVNVGVDDVDRDRTLVEDIDLFFRSCPLMIRRGFVKKIDLHVLPSDILCLLFEETDVQPIHRIEKALESYISILDQISRTGKVISKTRE